MIKVGKGFGAVGHHYIHNTCIFHGVGEAMSETPPIQRGQNLQNYFKRFIELRQTGSTPEEAWQEIQRMYADLATGARHQLTMMIQIWENRYGKNYRPSRFKDPHETMVVSAHKSDENPEAQAPSVAKPAIKKLTKRATPTDEEAKTRPFLSLSTGANTYFGLDSTLLLHAVGNIKALPLKIGEKTEIIVGRSSPDNVLIPDVDLASLFPNPQSASRLHAAIRREGQRLMLLDLESKNATYVNGNRLLPQEVHVLRDGDMLTFGNLSLRVQFVLENKKAP